MLNNDRVDYRSGSPLEPCAGIPQLIPLGSSSAFATLEIYTVSRVYGSEERSQPWSFIHDHGRNCFYEKADNM